MTVEALLLYLDPWLRARCRMLSAQLPALPADEAYQQVVEEFLRELDRWLQQDATVDVRAQARTLMSFCLRHVKTRAIRDGKRHGELTPQTGTDRDDLFDEVAPPAAPVDGFRAAEIVTQIRSATTPPNALCLLSLRLPGIVESVDAQRAKEWTRGGAQAVPRPLPEAWAYYSGGRDRLKLVAGDMMWKAYVGVAWYTDGPPELVDERTRKDAASKVERYANRGADDLRAVLLGEGEELG